MTDQTKRLCDNINAHFDEMETRIQQVREAVATALVRVARAVQVRPDGDVADASKGIRRWQTSHDAEKLAHHAHQNEQYTLAFTLTALFAIDAAEAAALEALDALLTAYQVAKDHSAQTVSCGMS